MIYIALDDTDMLDTRGTGHLAREIAVKLAETYPLLGVTRHQLSSDPRVPCTQKNSSAVIHLDAPPEAVPDLLAQTKALMLADFIPGSDPGLCVAAHVPAAITAFGHEAKNGFVAQSDAWALAKQHDMALLGLGGTEDGVIGALASVGLAAEGEDGRYIIVGTIRELAGLQPVAAILAAGITAVTTLDGTRITEGLVLADKLRPSRRNGRPTLFVEQENDYWLPLKLD